MIIHPDVTLDRVTEALERAHSSLDNPGFCIRCGAEAEGVEPDARKYACESCGEPGVYGVEELLLCLAMAG
jgi:predicted amidophosphoribosyltransferase